MAHHCHAKSCAVEVRPELLMCAQHWRLVPLAIRRAVLVSYRRGQCNDKAPSVTWINAATAAIGAVAARTGFSVRPAEADALRSFGFEPLADEFNRLIAHKDPP